MLKVERKDMRPNKFHTLTLAHDAIVDAAILAQQLHIVYEGDIAARWHAAWVIEKVALQEPMILLGERHRLKRLAMSSESTYGLRRLLLTTLYHLPDEEEFDVFFFNYLLQQMIDLQSPPAVQAIAMKLAERHSRIAPSLHDEFLCIISNIEFEYYPPALRSVARRYLKKMKATK